MKLLLEKINRLHKEFNEELDIKLAIMDKCLKNGKECPCESEECEIDYKALKELDNLYNVALKEIASKKEVLQ